MSLLQKALAAASPGVAQLYVEDYFSTYLYTGTGASQTITTGVDTSTGGGMVWIKGRSGSTDHAIYDTVRGATKELISNSTAGETTQSTGLTAFSTTGFTVGALAKLNTSSATYGAWTFRKAKKFFDVQTKSHTIGSSSTVNLSNLGTVGCVMVRGTGAGNWHVWHRSLTAGTLLYLSYTDLPFYSSLISVSGTTLTLSSSLATDTYVVYAFAHDAGGFGSGGSENIISCGSFTATSNVAVTLGYEPQFLLVKNVDFYDSDLGIGENWYILDTMRGMSHTNERFMYPNTTDAEANSTGNLWKPTPTGFISTVNNSQKHIYIAIRRGPMKTPTDATKVFKPVLASSSAPPLTADFPIDFVIDVQRAGGNHLIADRLRGQVPSNTNGTSAESSNSNYRWDYQTSAFSYASSSSGEVGECFRRAPGFLDVVCYSGNSTARTISHGLGVAPELIITKIRNGAGNWYSYVASLGAGKYVELNQLSAPTTSANEWNSTEPTSSVFSVGGASSNSNLSSYNYVAYLFASCPGVSKVGSYTGNGTSQTINCGFSAGARFVLIKRTSSTGDWYVFDTARGIVAGSDPFSKLNTNGAEATTFDAVDAASSGFVVNNDATNFPINVDTATYIFLAIA